MKQAGVADRIYKIEQHLSSHEAVCTERWLETISRIKRIETIMIGTAGSTIILLISLLLKT
tara:strand:+ start:777 stop:959 length:183 start_codon:yes stop_codon:yes gene_type:complete